MTEILGFDSRYWSGAYPEGYNYKFVYIKASEALGFVPENLEQQVRGAEDNNLEYGLYHFWRHNADPAAQAKHFYDTAKEYSNFGNLPPVIDLEDTNAKKSLAMVNHIHETCDAIEREFEQRPMIYTASWWWDAFAAPYFQAANWDLSKYELWVAHYNQYVEKPYLPKYFTDWNVWQYIGDWSAPGFNAKIDVNRAKAEWFSKYVEPGEDDKAARLKDIAMGLFDMADELNEIAGEL
jgi:lysozyme